MSKAKMMTKSPAKSIKLAIRFSEEDYERVRDWATSMGTTVSSAGRSVILDMIEDRIMSPRVETKDGSEVSYVRDVLELNEESKEMVIELNDKAEVIASQQRKLRGDVGRLGGNVNQIAYQLNRASKSGEKSGVSTSEVLDALQKTQDLMNEYLQVRNDVFDFRDDRRWSVPGTEMRF